MEENFSMEWNMEENLDMEWKIFGMEWKWNGRKLPVWNMEKSSSIPFHALATVKETEIEETIHFLSHFYHWCHFNWGEEGGGPSGYSYAWMIYQIR